MKSLALAFLLVAVPSAFGAQRTVDPTWLHRNIAHIPEKPADISTPSCHYKPVFGAGDSEKRIVRGVARFGEVTIDPSGHCKDASYSGEEQIYYILAGGGTLTYGEQKTPVKKDDFMYLPPQIRHGMANPSTSPLRFVVMGFNIPKTISVPAPPSQLQIANADDVKLEAVAGHPESTQYRLLLGGRKGTRDRLDCGIVVTSLFLMEFAPGGTNFPHHHDTAEEIYLVLDGHGDIAAGGGINGIEGLHPSGAGDAYFFRLNSTVGFYNRGKTKAHILAVRSWYPFPERDYQN
ncbi:MAG: cupin domain-containing protein [Acidobacteria bacterium]|nr:MAG: cupin domain-containing protein [Acidobacteriota bacterium]